MSSSLNQIQIIAGIIFFVWLSALSVFVFRVISRLQKLTKGAKQKDLMTVLEKFFKDIDKSKKEIDKLSKAMTQVEKEDLHNIKKIGLVRFNPFADTGGNQSFSLAVLDGDDNGLVISSLHSRDTTRIYAKPVKKGKGDKFELSDEEKRAIRGAKKVK